MPTIHTSASALIDAPSSVVYAILSDYNHLHKQILPKRHFSRLRVEKGGQGEGTVIRFHMSLGGIAREARMEVSEPRPGHTLVEKDFDSGAVTTFVVEPLDGDKHSQVTIYTEWTSHGLTGLMQRMFAPSMLRKVYIEELDNLGQLAKSMTAVEETA